MADSDMLTGFLAGQDNRNNNGGFFGNEGLWAVIILAIIFGWGRNGFGGEQNGGNGTTASILPYLMNSGSGAQRDYVLTSDFANVERKIDGVNSGLCDGFYAVNTSFGNLNNTLAQGFAGINTGIMTQGYETRLGTQALGAQLASCCCDIREGIQANTTQGVMNTNALSQQLAQCCCDNEKTAMQNRFDMAQYNCSTLQAIDKLGDRIMNQLSQDKYDAVMRENAELRTAANNAVLINQLRPCPVPSYPACNPWASQAPYGSCGSCGL